MTAVTRLLYGLVIALLLLGCNLAVAQMPTLDTKALPRGPLGAWAVYLQERDDAPLSLAQAQAALARGDFRANGRPITGFGLSARPIWIALQLSNLTDAPQALRLGAGMSWIDRIDVHLIKAGLPVAQWRSGAAATRWPMARPTWWPASGSYFRSMFRPVSVNC